LNLGFFVQALISKFVRLDMIDKENHNNDNKKIIKEIFDENIILKYVSVSQLTINHIK